MSGFYPPISDSRLGTPAPLPAVWLSNPSIVANAATDAVPLVTAPLDEGIYVVWTSGPAWVNAGTDVAPVTDPADATAAAAKPHDGGAWAVAIKTGERIAVRARSGSVDVRIFRGA
ncbi:hypothetical protein [Salinarimonas rosea]|uniref:hypothetical protein n=1 Tax=Salinarimonas rosea TaxID=552063 RepID=UPI00048F549F|nr:hypothetical protein [Salinarimonas rosea]